MYMYIYIYIYVYVYICIYIYKTRQAKKTSETSVYFKSCNLEQPRVKVVSMQLQSNFIKTQTSERVFPGKFSA